MDYRVDVTITTSEMDRVLKPTVLMKIIDNNGDIRTFEINPEQFHNLRYSVARVLKVECSSSEGGNREEDERVRTGEKVEMGKTVAC
jgi:hypothetical protein